MIDPLIHLPYEQANQTLTALAVDYPHAHRVELHSHSCAQLLYAIQGIMVIETTQGRWIVPPTRAVWIQAGVAHSVLMKGQVKMRTLFIRAETAALPVENGVLEISPLLRELILAASKVPLDYVADSRDGRLMQFLLQELQDTPYLPFYLPLPKSQKLLNICQYLDEHPDNQFTLKDWAEQLAISPKTFQRQFSKETGLTFIQWRQLARLFASLESLAMGQSIAQVALQHGYSSQSAYTVLFKKFFNVTPSQFLS